jgi:general stress protein YciG
MNKDDQMTEQEETSSPVAVPAVETPRVRLHRGFAAMSSLKQREIASAGGKAAHRQGAAHEWTSEAARVAGRKGGLATHRGRGEAPGHPADGAPGGDASGDGMGRR